MSTSSNAQQIHNFSRESSMPPPPPPPSIFPRRANQDEPVTAPSTPTQLNQTKKPDSAAVTCSQDEAVDNSSKCVIRDPEAVSHETMMDFRNSDSELTEPPAQTISKPSQPTTAKNKARGRSLSTGRSRTSRSLTRTSEKSDRPPPQQPDGQA